MIIISQVMLGIFGSCISGSDHSSLYTYIEYHGAKDNLKYQDQLYRLSIVSTLVSYILSGFILKMDPIGVLTFMLTACTYAVAFIFYIMFVFSKKASGVSKK